MNLRHGAVAEWSKRSTCFRLVESFVGSNLGRGLYRNIKKWKFTLSHATTVASQLQWL